MLNIRPQFVTTYSYTQQFIRLNIQPVRFPSWLNINAQNVHDGCVNAHCNLLHKYQNGIFTLYNSRNGGKFYKISCIRKTQSFVLSVTIQPLYFSPLFSRRYFLLRWGVRFEHEWKIRNKTKSTHTYTFNIFTINKETKWDKREHYYTRCSNLCR